MKRFAKRRHGPRVQAREGHVDQFLQHLVNAVILGGTYALLGIGLTLIFGIMRVVNFTHGELYAFRRLLRLSRGRRPRAGFLPRPAGCSRRRGPARRIDRDHAAAADAQRRHRHGDAGDDRRLDRDAEYRAPGLGWCRQGDRHAVPGCPAGDRTGFDILAAGVRARRRPAPDRRQATWSSTAPSWARRCARPSRTPIRRR